MGRPPDGLRAGTAVAAIPSSGPGAPGIANPWLVKLGPGTFDLGAQSLALPDYIVLEGAGGGDELATPALTRIRSQGFATPSGTIVAPSNVVVVRDVYVSNSGGAAYAVAFHNPGTGSVVLQRVFLDSDGGTTTTAGLRSGGTDAFVWVIDSIVHAAGTTATNGIVLSQAGSASARIERTRVSVGAAGPTNTAISVDGTLELTDSTVRVTSLVPDITVVGVGAAGGSITRSVATVDCSGTGGAEGVHPTRALFGIGESSITAFPNTCSSYGVLNSASSLNVVASFLGGARALETAGATVVGVHRSTLSGGTFAISNTPGATMRIGASQVSGPVQNAGTLTCVASYDAVFAPLSCP
jgi:hypothetical protein